MGVVTVAKAGFGTKLRAFRRAAGLSQAELADKAGIHRRTVIKIERGERDPQWETAVALAHALGLEVTAFLPKKRRPKKK
jgi:DNA-binding XRE family transcriptional regulator